MGKKEDKELREDIENLELTETAKRYAKQVKITAVVVAAAVLVAGAFGISKKIKGNTPVSNPDYEVDNTKVEDYTAEDYASMPIKYTDEELGNMSFEQLDSVYNEYNVILHQDLFELLEEIQDNMNNVTLPSIKTEEDGDKQLYLNAEEIIGTFMMANADVYATEHFARLFGNSGLLNSEKVQENYIKTARIMTVYYSRATQQSGIADLFMSEEDKELVKRYEDLIIAYNTANTKTDKVEAGKNLVNFFNELVDPAIIDNAASENKGPVSHILTSGLAFAQANRIIDEETYNHLINVNEVITCDELYSQIEIAENRTVSLGTAPTGIYRVVLEEPRAMNDKNVKDLDRNIEYKFEDGTSIYSSSVVSNQTTSQTTNQTTQTQQEITKDEANQQYGEQAVVDAEKEAASKIEEENKKKAEYDRGYKDGWNLVYEEAYDLAASQGIKLGTSYTSKGSNYQNGMAAGIIAGINKGYSDGMVEYNAKLNSTTKEEVVETPGVISSIEETPEKVEESKQETIIVEEQPVVEQQQPNVDEGEEIDPDFARFRK